ncbi:MAG: PP2C family protein-serine/threonine phosphatase [Prochlorococcaceae cyanobacterium]
MLLGRRGSLTWMIASRVGLSLIALFLVYNTVVDLQERRAIKKQTEEILSEENAYLALLYGGKANEVLSILKDTDNRILRGGAESAPIEQEFSYLGKAFPGAEFYLRDSKRNTTIAKSQGAKSLTDQDWQQRRQEMGNMIDPQTSVSYLHNLSDIGIICFNRNLTSEAEDRQPAQGKQVSACWRADKVNEQFEVHRLLGKRKGPLTDLYHWSAESPSHTTLPKGMYAMVGSDRKVYIPTTGALIGSAGANNSGNPLATNTTQGFSEAEWQKILGSIEKIHAARPGTTVLGRTVVQNKPYLVNALRLGPYWTSLLVLSEVEASALLRQDISRLMVLQALALLIVMGAVVLGSHQIAKPITAAGKALKRLSRGDFEIDLPNLKGGELGRLYIDINKTSRELKILLDEKSANAVREQQLKTAKQIQKGFLVQHMPVSDKFRIAADFTPAYEIGADWYDAICGENAVYVVIADVCDKGIPSALFMSVFRTLLRYTIQERLSSSREDNGNCLEVVMHKVNHYMTENHGELAMFATVFIAAYHFKESRLEYVSAGHEPAQLMSSNGIVELPSTGPALGIFPQARFNYYSIPVHPGDILVTYTDGLTDARDKSGESWSKERLMEVLSNLSEEDRTAPALLSQLKRRVGSFMGEAEQFDDLTILILEMVQSATHSQSVEWATTNQLPETGGEETTEQQE